jgi:hypothetical protein
MKYGWLRAAAGALALIGIGVGAASFAFEQWRRGQRDFGKDVEALRADIDLVKRASRHKRELPIGPGTHVEGQLPYHQLRPSAQVPAPQASALEPDSASAPTPEEAEYRAGVVVAANDKALSDAYSNETLDPEWSGSAAVTLRSTYEGAGFEGVTTEIGCKSTLCRVDFRYEDGPNGESNWRNIMHRMPWSGSGRATFNAETRTGSFFIAREGHDLPNVDVTKLDY